MKCIQYFDIGDGVTHECDRQTDRQRDGPVLR